LSQAGGLVIGSKPYFTDRAKQLAALAATPQASLRKEFPQRAISIPQEWCETDQLLKGVAAFRPFSKPQL